MLFEVFRPLGPHSEAQVKLTLPGGGEIELFFEPPLPQRAYLVSSVGISGVAAGEIEVTVYHEDISPHTVELDDYLLLHGVSFVRLVQVTAERSLYLRLHNLTTLSKTIWATLAFFDLEKDVASRLLERALGELIELVR